MKKNKLVLIFIILLPIFTFGQGRLYEGPEDPAADISEIRSGYMNGNRIYLYFENTTQLANYPRRQDSKWPNTYEGVTMLDNVSMVVGGQVFVKNDSIPVTNLVEINDLASSNELDTLYFIEGHGYPALHSDKNFDNTVEWGLYPVPGYANPTQDYPAMSNKSDSWPIEGWPSRGFEKKWPGEWNGRFGRGIKYADLETYFVSNDAQDLESIIQRHDPEENLITEGPRYYPRPGKYIGDLNENVTIQKGLPWGGLGLRIEVRGFQWNNPEARDMLFWEYNITNISDYDLINCGFGYHFDPALGDEPYVDDEFGYFDTKLELAYCWDNDGIGRGGLPTGILGMAFLESPGLAFDNIDNDEDGLLDEKRDNPAGPLIGPTDGIYDVQKFLDFYHLDEADLKVHYEGDEDQDWDDGNDLNGNGTYAYRDVFGVWRLERGEYAGDDVGLDGVGPSDLNYYGPDEGECNHRPDFLEGFGSEPDFAATDVNESDMLGLTMFHQFTGEIKAQNQYVLNNDVGMWNLMKSNLFTEYIGAPQTIHFAFSSAIFPFYKGRTERISMGVVHSYDNLSGLLSDDHRAPNLYMNKKIAQVIYERDYRFAQAPLMPTLSATAGDGKVILTWDDVSDKYTREALLQNTNDFEGYKIYRSTDKLMADPEVITDGQGTTMFKKPIYQCDIVDSLEGYTDFGIVGGRAFYLGDETGLTHYFVDENVQNGKTYYYAIVAYDYGIKDIAGGLAPAENNIVIELDEAEEIIRMGKNVAVVTPHQKAAGYSDPNISIEDTEIQGSADISLSVVDRNSLRPNHTYKIKFNVDTLGHARTNRIFRHPLDYIGVNNGLSVYDVTDNRLVYEENIANYPLKNISLDGETRVNNNSKTVNFSYYRNDKAIRTDIFDGIQLELNNLAALGEIDDAKSGWIVGERPINIIQGKYESLGFPYTYDIIFTDNEEAHSPKVNRQSYLYNLESSTGILVGSSWITTEYLLGKSFSFYVLDREHEDSDGNFAEMEIIVEDVNQNGSVEILEDRFLVGNYHSPGNDFVYWTGTIFGFDFHELSSEEELPKNGDIYRVEFKRPFTDRDSIMFITTPAIETEEVSLNEEMDKIKVVPNPYIMTNSMEPAVGNRFLNQRRRILFTHVPSESEIRVYTSSGVLVDNIIVENEISNGTVHWDLLSKEDLEIAAGMYIYHVKSKVTGKEKIGKFAVIK